VHSAGQRKPRRTYIATVASTFCERFAEGDYQYNGRFHYTKQHHRFRYRAIPRTIVRSNNRHRVFGSIESVWTEFRKSAHEVEGRQFAVEVRSFALESRVYERGCRLLDSVKRSDRWST